MVKFVAGREMREGEGNGNGKVKGHENIDNRRRKKKFPGRDYNKARYEFVKAKKTREIIFFFFFRLANRKFVFYFILFRLNDEG